MIYGLLGKKLGHSYSPEIHEAFGRYSYRLIELREDQLEDFLKSPEIGGLNVTIPYKEAVVKYCSRLTPLAEKIGAVNTIYREQGAADHPSQLVGDNTDYDGFLALLRKAGISLTEKKVVVLGSGGASRMVQQACRDLGVRDLTIVTRDGREGTIPYESLNHHTDSEIIINTTPVGMYPNNGESPVNLDLFPHCQAVVDLIYNPLTTRLLAQAKERNLIAAGGLSMLVDQAAKACRRFTGQEVPSKDIERITRELEGQIRNIVLIGMPGCGKTTMGRLLSEALRRPFLDMDSLIEQERGLTIPQIFERHGEEEFRRLERELAERIGKERGQIISTGGGIVLHPENVVNLSQNGTLIFLDRPISLLARNGRPLSVSTEAIEKMARDRMALYKGASDYIISMDESPEINLEKLMKIIQNK